MFTKKCIQKTCIPPKCISKMVYNKRKTTKSIQITVSNQKKYLKNYIQQIFIPQKPNLYIIINVYNKNVDNKKVCKVHKLRYIKQSRIHLCSLQ